MSRAKSLLLPPPKGLSSCFAVGIFRDTRGVQLSDLERFNYFPAAPLVAATLVIDGELRFVQQAGLEQAQKARPLPRMSVTAPQDQPTISWSPGPVAALTIGFYPDAWSQLGYGFDSAASPVPLASALSSFDGSVDPQAEWVSFCDQFSTVWQAAREMGKGSDWIGSDRVSDWSRYLMTRLSTRTTGHSVRTVERHLKRITGQTRQSLSFYAAIEDLHHRRVKAPNAALADIANDAGYSDQSHMGRAVRRATGFSPAKLNQMIETDEAFWCYRLLGERF